MSEPRDESLVEHALEVAERDIAGMAQHVPPAARPKLRGWLHLGSAPVALVLGLVLMAMCDEEALRWLYTPDDTLPGTPAEALRGNRATEVKRRAQALGF